MMVLNWDDTSLKAWPNKYLAEVVKNCAEAELRKAEAEVQRRTLASKLRKEEAEARLAEARAANAEIELLQKLRNAGIVLHRDAAGNWVFSPAPSGFDWQSLMAQIVSLRALAPCADPDVIAEGQKVPPPSPDPSGRRPSSAALLVAEFRELVDKDLP